jgi:hypothetical protein
VLTPHDTLQAVIDRHNATGCEVAIAADGRLLGICGMGEIVAALSRQRGGGDGDGASHRAP